MNAAAATPRRWRESGLRASRRVRASSATRRRWRSGDGRRPSRRAVGGVSCRGWGRRSCGQMRAIAHWWMGRRHSHGGYLFNRRSSLPRRIDIRDRVPRSDYRWRWPGGWHLDGKQLLDKGVARVRFRLSHLTHLTLPANIGRLPYIPLLRPMAYMLHSPFQTSGASAGNTAFPLCMRRQLKSSAQARLPFAYNCTDMVVRPWLNGHGTRRNTVSASADKTTSTEEPVDTPQEADQRKDTYDPERLRAAIGHG